MNDFYISLETAKQLKEWGCEFEAQITRRQYKPEKWYWNGNGISFGGTENDVNIYQAYHILEEICVKYAKEFFVDDEKTVLEKTCWILHKLQQDEKKEAEKYILEHTIFNPKNK